MWVDSFNKFCKLICGELHEQHPDACQDIELGSPFINDYGQHLHFQNIAVISSMVLRTEFNYSKTTVISAMLLRTEFNNSKNSRTIWHVFTYRIQLFEKTTVISDMFLHTKLNYSKNDRNIWHVFTYKIPLFKKQP